jgi:signal transduction histidine kinase
VTTRYASDCLEASVADNGSGIPPELIDQIWNPFFTTKTVGKGSGLGLALVYDIVKNHGGEIAVTSTVGKGTEFSVRFPVCQ